MANLLAVIAFGGSPCKHSSYKKPSGIYGNGTCMSRLFK